MMEKYSEAKHYTEGAFLLRINLRCGKGFSEEKFAKYVKGEELINTCVKCNSDYQYYMDVTLPYGFDFELIRADMLTVVPDIIHIDTGVVSYELCNPRDIAIAKQHRKNLKRKIYI